jgi:light-regulated signal transduction histidine kinase (bacteriophytochrome)
MEMAARGGDGTQSLRTAAGICLASPVAACVVLPDKRIHVFNEPWRALFGAQESLPSALSSPFAGALAGTSALVETPTGSHTVTLSLIPVHDDKTNVVGAVLVSAAKWAAAASTQQLDAFRYTLSHDLLSPLRTLQEMARVLERDHAAALPPDASIFLGHITQGANKLAERVEAIIRLVQLNAQPLNCHRVDIARLVNEVLMQLRAQYGDEATVVLGELPAAQADADLARQLFTQLLSNAFKFTRNVAAPRIEIGCAVSDAGQTGYFVVDNGVGFDMKYAGRLFGLFQRMHGEAQFEGTGAGLAIARGIVERHGGAIRVEAMKDRGAKFIFTLPSASPGTHTDA